jgi:hypothetical protein
MEVYGEAVVARFARANTPPHESRFSASLKLPARLSGLTFRL